MGVSDNYAMPVIVFSVIYFMFITIMLGQIGVDIATEDFVLDDFSFGNVIANISYFGIWNGIIFLPILVALGYVTLSLVTPAWI